MPRGHTGGGAVEAVCATPGCRNPSHGRSRYCSSCIDLRRRASQRARRGVLNPAGSLPADQVQTLAAELRQIRDALDYADKRRYTIERDGADPNTLFAVYDGLSDEMRAALTGMREILDSWTDRNAIAGQHEPS